MSTLSPADDPEDDGPAGLQPLAGFITKSDRAYEALRNAILDGYLQSGSRINLAQTSQRLGISETPVREALKRLESERLVRVEPYVGFIVAEFSLPELIENLILRREIEAVATRLAASSLTADDLVLLREHIEQMEAAAQRADWQSYMRTNKSFHHTLISRCPLPVIRRMAIELWEIGERSRALFVQRPRTEGSNEEHRDMLQAIEAGDYERLGDLVRHQKAVSVHVALELIGGPVRADLQKLLQTLDDDLLVTDQSRKE